MINSLNNGYNGFSRSVRSYRAIKNYEVPLSMITKDLIQNYLNENNDFLKKDEIDVIKKISISKVKFVAKNIVRESSWHHTGQYFNKTNHYSLDIIIEKILEYGFEKINEEYNNYILAIKSEKENKKKNYNLGYIKVQVWGGTKRSPKIIGFDERIGVVVGNWLYYMISCSKEIRKYNITANKVEEYYSFSEYKDLTKAFPKYKNNKKYINAIIKNIIKL